MVTRRLQHKYAYKNNEKKYVDRQLLYDKKDRVKRACLQHRGFIQNQYRDLS